MGLIELVEEYSLLFNFLKAFFQNWYYYFLKYLVGISREATRTWSMLCVGVSFFLTTISFDTVLFKQSKFHRFSSVQFSRSVVSDSLRTRGQQHSRPPCVNFEILCPRVIYLSYRSCQIYRHKIVHNIAYYPLSVCRISHITCLISNIGNTCPLSFVSDQQIKVCNIRY